MTWVAGFAHDIFISYAWVDNQVAEGRAEENGWVTLFHRHLNVELSKKVGRMNVVGIWRDTREIQGNQLLDRAIREAVQGSAVFLALDSTGFLESEYCRHEIQNFHEKAKNDPAGLVAGDRSRIFHLLLNKIPQSEWPEQVGPTDGFPFYESEEPGGRGQPSDHDSKRFRDCVRDLADA